MGEGIVQTTKSLLMEWRSESCSSKHNPKVVSSNLTPATMVRRAKALYSIKGFLLAHHLCGNIASAICYFIGGVAQLVLLRLYRAIQVVGFGGLNSGIQFSSSLDELGTSLNCALL